MSVARNRNVGAYLRGLFAFASQTFTANTDGSGTDNVIQNGEVIDREDLNQLILSAKLIAGVVTASLGPATCSVTLSIKDSADGVNFDAFKSLPVVVLDSDGKFVVQGDINLAGARRYLRVSVNCLFSASSTDTAVVWAVLVLGGADELPITENTGGSS